MPWGVAMSEAQARLSDEPDMRAALQQRAAQMIDSLSSAHVKGALQDVDAKQESSQAPDLMTLLTEMAGMRQEVRLQRREVVKIRELQVRAAQCREDDAASLQRALHDKLKPFLDVRDALVRAAEQQIKPAASALSVWQRFLATLRAAFRLDAAPVMDASILLRQLDRALAQADIVPIAVVGEEFDPQTMVAVSVVQTDAVAPGAVAQQVVGGFLLESKIWRPAQVVVNQAAPARP